MQHSVIIANAYEMLAMAMPLSKPCRTWPAAALSARLTILSWLHARPNGSLLDGQHGLDSFHSAQVVARWQSYKSATERRQSAWSTMQPICTTLCTHV